MVQPQTIAGKGENHDHIHNRRREQQQAARVGKAQGRAQTRQESQGCEENRTSQEGGPKAEDGPNQQEGVIATMQRAKGATLDEIMKATGWQRHYADVRIMPTCIENPACGAGIAAMESA
jgi:hypothetical protein